MMINVEVLLPYNGEYTQADKVIGRDTDRESKHDGTYNRNPNINTRIYDIMF